MLFVALFSDESKKEKECVVEEGSSQSQFLPGYYGLEFLVKNEEPNGVKSMVMAFRNFALNVSSWTIIFLLSTKKWKQSLELLPF